MKYEYKFIHWFSWGAHNNTAVSWITTPNDVQLTNHLKKFVKAKWNYSNKCLC